MRLARSLGWLALALWIAAPATAIDTWWLKDRADDDFGNPSNWNNGDPETEDVYVTTSDAAATPDDAEEAVAEFDETMEVGQTYIGGWKSNFDAGHGDPKGHSGTLDIIGGLLETEENTGSPPCAYIRVGYRGARGTVNQSSGTVKSCSGVSMSYSATDGNGTAIWNLSGGAIDSWGLDVGGQGFGFFDMTGGSVHNDSFDETSDGTPNCGGESQCSTKIGRGAHHPEARFVPGFGVMSQTGGTHETELLELGFENGSAGAYSLREDAVLEVTDRLTIGYLGTGVMTVAGEASVSSPYIHVGQGVSGFGQLTIHTGSVTATSLVVGKSGLGGLGHLVLSGIGATVNVGQLSIYDRSRLSVHVDEEPFPGGGHNSRIEVGGTATLYPNAEIFVERFKDYTPTLDQKFVVLCATTISAPSAPTMKTDGWKVVWPLETATCASGSPGKKLEVQYCGECEE